MKNKFKKKNKRDRGVGSLAPGENFAGTKFSLGNPPITQQFSLMRAHQKLHLKLYLMDNYYQMRLDNVTFSPYFPRLLQERPQNSFSGMFTISDAVTITLLQTDDGRFPQERKSSVAPWRQDGSATGQKGARRCSGNHPFHTVANSHGLFRDLQSEKPGSVYSTGRLNDYVSLDTLLGETRWKFSMYAAAMFRPLCRFLPLTGPEAAMRE